MPKTKAYQEHCHQSALALHPGTIVEFRAEGAPVPSYRYWLRDAAGVEWVVLCDSATGKITADERIIAP